MSYVLRPKERWVPGSLERSCRQIKSIEETIRALDNFFVKKGDVLRQSWDVGSWGLASGRIHISQLFGDVPMFE